MTSAICCPLWSSVYECHKVECAFTSLVRTECDMFVDVLYAVLYVCVSCFVVPVCAVSRRYIYVCNCDIFSVVNVYLDHLLCVLMVECMSVLVNVMLSLMSVMSPPPTLCNLSVRTVVAVTFFEKKIY